MFKFTAVQAAWKNVVMRYFTNAIVFKVRTIINNGSPNLVLQKQNGSSRKCAVDSSVRDRGRSLAIAPCGRVD